MPDTVLQYNSVETSQSHPKLSMKPRKKDVLSWTPEIYYRHSAWQGVGILNAECAVRTSFINDATIPEVEIAMTLCLCSLNTRNYVRRRRA